jgi:hypothetical protein
VNQLPLGVKQLPLRVERLPLGVKQLPLGVEQLPLGVKQLPLGVEQLPLRVKQLPPGVEGPRKTMPRQGCSSAWQVTNRISFTPHLLQQPTGNAPEGMKKRKALFHVVPFRLGEGVVQGVVVFAEFRHNRIGTVQNLELLPVPQKFVCG